MTDRAEALPSPGPRARAAPHSGASTTRRGRGESGAALVEFSLVVVLFVMMLVGIIVYGLALSMKQSVTNAAAAGARAAVGAADPVDAAKDQVEEAMSGFSGDFDPTETTAVVAPCVIGSGQCITVVVKAHPSVRDVPFISIAVKDPLTSTAVVQIS